MQTTTPADDTLAGRLTRAVLIGLTDAAGVAPAADRVLEPAATLQRPGQRYEIYRHPSAADRYVTVAWTTTAPGPRVLADGDYVRCRRAARSQLGQQRRSHRRQRRTGGRVRALRRIVTSALTR